MDVDITTPTNVGDGGGDRNNGTPKDLYLCSSWEELEAKVNGIGLEPQPTTEPGSSVQEALPILNEMCLSGVLADMGKDEEMAYLNYNRYLTAYILLSQRDEYKTDMSNTGMLKVEENVGLIVKIVGTLKASLIRRYETLAAQKAQNEKKIRTVLEQHRDNLDAEINASRNLKKVREELGSLRMVKQILEEDFGQQQGQGDVARARVTSASSNAADNDNVPEQLKCPVCFEIFQDQVLQCKNGHSICSTCYNDDKLTDCPECRIQFGGTAVRNRALEGLVSTWKMDCPFRDNGCKEKILIKAMTPHADSCFYGQSEEKRQMIKVDMDIKGKQEEVKKCQEMVQQAYLRRAKTEADWKGLESKKEKEQFGSVLDKIVKDFNLREKEHELLLETRLNGLQLSLV